MAKLRRISQMVSTVLRHGTTRHLDPAAPTDDGYVEMPDWQPGNHDANLAALLQREHDEVRAEGRKRGIDIDALTVDPQTNTIRDDRTGQPLTRDAFNALVERFKPQSSGVGKTTLLRALVVGSQTRGKVSLRGGDWDGLLQRLHAARGEAVQAGDELGGSPRPSAGHPTAGRSAQAGGMAESARSGAQAEAEGQQRFQPFAPENKLLYSRSGGTGRGVTPAAAAEALRSLQARMPVLAQRVTLVPSRESLREADYHPDDWHGMQSAEGFYDPRTGQTHVILDQVHVRENETPASAIARVIIHERVGHAGLAALRQTDATFARQWDDLVHAIATDPALKDTRDEIATLRDQEGYHHLNDSQLVEEWFTRQAEQKTPAELDRLRPGIFTRMWRALREALGRITGRLQSRDWINSEVQEFLGRSHDALARHDALGVSEDGRVRQSQQQQTGATARANAEDAANTETNTTAHQQPKSSNPTGENTASSPMWKPASDEVQEGKFRLNQPAIKAIDQQLYENGKQPQTPNSAGESRSRLESAESYIRGGPGSDGKAQGARAGTSPVLGSGQSGGSGQVTGKPVNAKEARKALLEWAATNGLLIKEWPSTWRRNSSDDHGGKEHHSFLVSEAGRLRWVKATKGNGSSFGLRPQDDGRSWSLTPKATALEYIDRLIQSNRWGDDVHLHGVYHNPQTGEVSIITSQQHAIDDTPMTDDDLVEAMSKAGFHEAGNKATFYRPSDNTAVFDAHLANVARRGDQIIPFDVLIMNPPPNLARHLKK